MASRVSEDFVRQLQGFCLTTAEILYRLPDHLSLLQTYVWQDYDLAPEFPALHKFLDFWSNSLDGPLHSVRVAHVRLVGSGRNPHGQGAIRAALSAGRVGQISRRPFRLAWPSRPTMMWSWTATPSGWATAMMSSVILTSWADGVGSPDG